MAIFSFSEVTEPNYFDGEEVFKNLDHEMFYELDSDEEDDGKVSIQC